MKERQIIINKTSYFATFLYHLRDYLPIRVHYPHRIYPFTGFSFFNQTPHSSMIQGEGRSGFLNTVVTVRMRGAHHPYAWGLRNVCTVLERHLHRNQRDGTTLHPVLPMNKAAKQKSETDEGGKKDTTSFHVRRKFTKVLLILANTVTTYFVQLLPGSQIQKEHSDQY